MGAFQLLSFGPEGWGSQLASGVWLTIRLAVATLPFGLASGLLLAIMINGRNRMLSRAALVFTTIFRALPELLTIFIIYYGLQFLIQAVVDAAWPGTSIEINGFLAGLFALGVVFASFASEIFVAGLRALPKGQAEAAHALGLSRGTAFVSVIAPQLFRLTLPGVGNLWFVLLKDTALVSVISLSDLMRQTTIAVSNTKQPIFFYGVTCLIYLCLSLVSGAVVALLEVRTNRAYRGAR
ncbi:ABC transporter permease subunit [Lichenihabitans sp. Uapishka_5]|uniref:ABC transporter permease n=1 Tax=Lichenihabitans sp. Uapishka_5 TaxID=3037302 RepID=UPI0029E80373|nr:ABC transporter permease subunit [Lichenihabitans sp. Uapishka_5]MDX7952563.1 ABC transporter permease subunit [Lichenihabitans sp. Uapishka_5]